MSALFSYISSWLPSAEPDNVDQDTSSDSGSRLAKPVPGEELKLVLVVRQDLKMSVGKTSAQCSHATLACYKTLVGSKAGREISRLWEKRGQAKIVVSANSHAEIMELYQKAVTNGLVAEVIQDAGRTEVDAGTITVLGVGPASKSQVDQITRDLKLLK